MDNKQSLAWFAGLFEGEGCFRISKGHSQGIMIQSTDLDVLEKVQNLFGGSIYTAYDRPDKPNWKKCYQWYLGKGSEDLVRMIYPYLMSRRQHRADEWLRLVKKPRNSKREKILVLLSEGLSNKQIAEQLDCSPAYVSIIKNKT